MKNKIFSTLIIFAFLGFLLIDFSAAEQPDFNSHLANCKMKIASKRLQDFDRDIMKLARRITDQELNRYCREREIQSAPSLAPKYIPPSYPPNLSPSFFVSVRPSVSSVCSVGLKKGDI